MTAPKQRDYTPIERALNLLNGVLENETTDDQAIELAKGYTIIAAAQAASRNVDAMNRLAAALEGLVDTVAPFADAITAERLTEAARTLAELHTYGVEDSGATSELVEAVNDDEEATILLGNEPVPTEEQAARIRKQRQEEFEAGVKAQPIGYWDEKRRGRPSFEDSILGDNTPSTLKFIEFEHPAIANYDGPDIHTDAFEETL